MFIYWQGNDLNLISSTAPLFTTSEIPTGLTEPSPVNIETKYLPDMSFTDLYKTEGLEQDSFKTMSMEQESASSMSVEQGSVRSLEQDIQKNGLSDSPEIEDGKVKSTLKEIITEIDVYAENDDILKESSKTEAMEVTSDGVTETRSTDIQSSQLVKTNGQVCINVHVEARIICVHFMFI